MLRLELKKQRWLERNVAVLAIQATQNHHIFRMESEILSSSLIIAMILINVIFSFVVLGRISKPQVM